MGRNYTNCDDDEGNGGNTCPLPSCFPTPSSVAGALSVFVPGTTTVRSIVTDPCSDIEVSLADPNTIEIGQKPGAISSTQYGCFTTTDGEVHQILEEELKDGVTYTHTYNNVASGVFTCTVTSSNGCYTDIYTWTKQALCGASSYVLTSLTTS